MWTTSVEAQLRNRNLRCIKVCSLLSIVLYLFCWSFDSIPRLLVDFWLNDYEPLSGRTRILIYSILTILFLTKIAPSNKLLKTDRRFSPTVDCCNWVDAKLCKPVMIISLICCIIGFGGQFSPILCAIIGTLLWCTALSYKVC
jgi:hypothetical protein